MNQKRQRIKIGNKELKKAITPLKEIDLSNEERIPKGMTRAFRNTRYTVMVFDNSPTSKGSAIRALIQKHNDSPLINHWKEIQNIKNEIFGTETTAIEYYPSVSNLIDDFNIYWIWVFPEGVLPIPVTN